MNRRGFLSGIALAVGLTLAPGFGVKLPKGPTFKGVPVAYEWRLESYSPANITIALRGQVLTP